jgi:hypothetical protein
VIEVRVAFVVTHGAARFFFRRDCERWQGKSELPKYSGTCPNIRGKQRFVGQSHRNVATWLQADYLGFTGLILATLGSKRSSGGWVL